MEVLTLDLSNVRTKEIENLLAYCKSLKIKLETSPHKPFELILSGNKNLVVCLMYYIRANKVQYQVAVKNPQIFDLFVYMYPDMSIRDKDLIGSLLPPKYKILLKLSGDM